MGVVIYSLLRSCVIIDDVIGAADGHDQKGVTNDASPEIFSDLSESSSCLYQPRTDARKVVT